MTEWIKTNDRLPERSQVVLICIVQHYVNAPNTQSVSPAWFDGGQFREYGGGMFPNVFHWPSHWMSLPEAPKEAV